MMLSLWQDSSESEECEEREEQTDYFMPEAVVHARAGLTCTVHGNVVFPPISMSNKSEIHGWITWIINFIELLTYYVANITKCYQYCQYVLSIIIYSIWCPFKMIQSTFGCLTRHM